MTRTSTAVAACLALLLCALAQAMSDSQRELLEAARSQPDLDRGAKLFRNCAVCHGPAGAGTLDGGVPRIGGQYRSVLMKQLVDYRHDRRWDLRMEHFADRHHLPDAQAIADVATYASQLKPSASPGVGSAELVERGEALYAHQCRSCHGPGADGDARKLIPRIAGQHYEYLQRQIYDAVDGRRPNFSLTHVRLLAHLDRDDIVGLSDYLSRLIPADRDAPVAAPTQSTSRDPP